MSVARIKTRESCMNTPCLEIHDTETYISISDCDYEDVWCGAYRLFGKVLPIRYSEYRNVMVLYRDGTYGIFDIMVEETL